MYREALHQLQEPLTAWSKYCSEQEALPGPHASASSASAQPAYCAAKDAARQVEQVLVSKDLKGFANVVVALVRGQLSHRGGAELYLVNDKAKRNFDGFPAGTDWAPVATAKPKKLATPIVAAQKLPDDMSATPQKLSSYDAEEDEEERKGRMALRIQRAWCHWWRQERVKRAITRLRLFVGVRWKLKIHALREQKAEEQRALERGEWEAQEAAARAASAGTSGFHSGGSDGLDFQAVAPRMQQHKERFLEVMRDVVTNEATIAKGGLNAGFLQAHTCIVCPQSVLNDEMMEVERVTSQAAVNARNEVLARASAKPQQQQQGSLGVSRVVPTRVPARTFLNPHASSFQPFSPHSAVTLTPQKQKAGFQAATWQQRQQQQQQLVMCSSLNPSALQGNSKALQEEILSAENNSRMLAMMKLTPHVARSEHQNNALAFKHFFQLYQGPVCAVLWELEAVDYRLFQVSQLTPEHSDIHSDLQMQQWRLNDARTGFMGELSAAEEGRCWGPCYGELCTAGVKALCEVLHVRISVVLLQQKLLWQQRQATPISSSSSSSANLGEGLTASEKLRAIVEVAGTWHRLTANADDLLVGGGLRIYEELKAVLHPHLLAAAPGDSAAAAAAAAALHRQGTPALLSHEHVLLGGAPPGSPGHQLSAPQRSGAAPAAMAPAGVEAAEAAASAALQYVRGGAVLPGYERHLAVICTEAQHQSNRGHGEPIGEVELSPTYRSTEAARSMLHVLSDMLAVRSNVQCQASASAASGAMNVDHGPQLREDAYVRQEVLQAVEDEVHMYKESSDEEEDDDDGFTEVVRRKGRGGGRKKNPKGLTNGGGSGGVKAREDPATVRDGGRGGGNRGARGGRGTRWNS
ncbi:hypothetical protein CEUSTIGMA_g10160.t1 [Chlamydomonas eustigma]|uniref:Uncharacterized protein n=1 Tax=Chlamydomonas eustigma TaxID=1157962 RepID=A0A250XI28_9CHLO|nr:hypothetical protein CEUSTIGMA_g10160.t1 [Chlamydomonas eustigma]|eukprot:GAX82734.1 hypothetical protein CEUSTIGMA_g10160.t1 [Chlamydomonas eustigma]